MKVKHILKAVIIFFSWKSLKLYNYILNYIILTRNKLKNSNLIIIIMLKLEHQKVFRSLNL